MSHQKRLFESQVAIVGLGLMGGSLALALQNHCGRLLGYDLDLSEAVPGGQLIVTLYWEALAPMELNNQVFVHHSGAQTNPGDGKLVGIRHQIADHGFQIMGGDREHQVFVAGTFYFQGCSAVDNGKTFRDVLQ